MREEQTFWLTLGSLFWKSILTSLAVAHADLNVGHSAKLEAYILPPETVWRKIEALENSDRILMCDVL